MKFSVVTVAYNAATTIRDTLASIVGQKGAAFESIVIDGGSTDGTQDIVASFGDAIAQFVSERDRGIYDAMNKGLARATGDVVAFLNADDFYTDDRVLRDVEAAFRSGAPTVVAGGVEQIDATGRVVRRIRPAGFTCEKIRWGIVPPHPGVFADRRLAQEAGGFDRGFKIAGDFDLFIRMSHRPEFRLATLDRTLVKMRTGGVSTTGLGTYSYMSKELKLALVKNGVDNGNWRVDLRALRKFPELFARLGS